MKLVLYIEDKKADIAGLDFVSNNLLTMHEMIKKSVELLKIRNRLLMTGKEWKIFLTAKSKME